MSIYDTLYPFQKKIVDTFVTRQRFGLFLDMGLGKTPTSLAFAEQNKCDKVLVISINSKVLEKVSDKGSWFDWASKSSYEYEMIQKSADNITINYSKDKPQMYVINFEGLFVHGKRSTREGSVVLNENIVTFISCCKRHNVAVIIDESHKIKNLQSSQTKAVSQIISKLQTVANDLRVYLCTGTPFTQGYIDLYAQLKFLGYKGTKTAFTDEFCIRGNVPGLLGWQQPIVGYKNVDDLFKLVHQYAITIRSEDVVDLPEKTFVNILQDKTDAFDMFTTEKRIGKDVLSFAKRHQVKLSEYDMQRFDTTHKVFNPFYRNIDYPSLDMFAETSGTAYLRARQLSVGFVGNAQKSIWYDKTRLKALEKFLTENEDNYLLFYNYTPELIEIFDICEKLGYNIDVYSGEIKSLAFYERYSNMTESEKLVNKKNVIIANFASGSTGMNWQEYNKCILFSIPIFKDYAQGHKRIHRVGQKSKTVFYYCFFQRNWLDTGMRRALSTSIDYTDKLFEDDLARVNALTEGTS